MSNRSLAPAGLVTPRRLRAPALVGALLVCGALFAVSAVRAQEPPPPIAVPTDPVPQGPPPTPTAKAKGKPGAPTPTVAPLPTGVATNLAAPSTGTPSDGAATPKSGGGGGGGSLGSSGGSVTSGTTTSAAPSPTSFNNEGTFKVSGTSGGGAVGGAPTPKPGKPVGAKTTGKQGKVAVKTKAPVPVAEWPGFRITDDGGSEVMVELSMATAAPTEHRAAGTITYAFPGAVVTKRNNKNPLLTIHFNTPVLDARLVPTKGELHLVVELRPGLDLAPVSGMRPATEGTKQQFFLKFPPGNYLPPTDDDVKTPNAKSEQGKPSGKKGATSSGAPAPTTEGGGAKTGPKP